MHELDPLHPNYRVASKRLSDRILAVSKAIHLEPNKLESYVEREINKLIFPVLYSGQEKTKVFEDARPFVLPYKSVDALIQEEEYRPGDKMDLPFKHCLFERRNSFFGSFPLDMFSEKFGNNVIHLAKGIMIKEINPYEYELHLLHCSLFFQPKDKTFLTAYGFIKINEDNTVLYTAAKAMVKEINCSSWAISKEKFFNREPKTRKKIKSIRDIVYVRPKKSTQDVYDRKNKRLEFSHRFEVRGHWRKIRGIGRDRQGKYVINGFTWINDFIKGPEYLPLIKKTRLKLRGLNENKTDAGFINDGRV